MADTYQPGACNHLRIRSIADFPFHLVYNVDSLCLPSRTISMFRLLSGRSRGHIIHTCWDQTRSFDSTYLDNRHKLVLVDSGVRCKPDWQG